MDMTAVVFNAGLGDISIGLQMAGFSIIAAYETDAKAAAIHETNIEAPIFPRQPEESDKEMISTADLLAVRLAYFQPPPGLREKDGKAGVDADDFLRLLEVFRPKVFLAILGAAASRGRQWDCFLQKISERHFRCSWKVIDTAETVGMPVVEHKVFLVGKRADTRWNFRFPEQRFPDSLPLKKFLEPDADIDPWYFNSVNVDRIPIKRSGGYGVYCWNHGNYEGTNRVRWDSWKIPLVGTGEMLRKMTHREIAKLKGFPVEYTLPEYENKSWLYRKLIYTVNVRVMKEVAAELIQRLTERPWRSAEHFEVILGECLSGLIRKHGIDIKNFVSEPNNRFDYIFRLPDRTLCVEAKYYSDRQIPPSRIRKICSQLALAAEAGDLVLALTSEVSAAVKRECWEQYRVSIWDIGNLLWLFSEFEEIKNEFIALLDYAVGDIEPVPLEWDMPYTPSEAAPKEVPTVLEPISETSAEAAQEQTERSEAADWRKRLDGIAPGPNQSKEYESFCCDILKYALNQYLTLWAVQPQTKDGLHRFDLCCKIKNGVGHDFFDTITSYFNTKYIVFEFKNYTQEITQREIYTTEKYLYGTALRKVAILVSRNGYDEHAHQAAKGSLRENGKLILCLTANDLLEMASIKAKGIDEPADFLSKMLDELLIHLEK